MPNYVPGIGPLSGCKLMIIGEAPGRIENDTGKPFQGPSGQMLTEDLELAGINREDCYITNVVKYQPPMNDFKLLDAIGIKLEVAVEELWNEIRREKPNCILTVGNHALEAVTNYSGILTYRGSILLAKDGVTKVVPTIHHAALYAHNAAEGLPYVYRRLIRHDIKRAVEESIAPHLDLPNRYLTVARNSLDIFRFFREYSSLRKASVDIESINSIPVCIGFAFNKHHAISIPLVTKVNNIPFWISGYSDLIEAYRIIDTILRTKQIIGQNFKYDDFKLNLMGFRIPNVYSDTLIKTRVIFPELPTKGQATQASLWTREPYYKDEGKEFKLGKSPLDQLFLYNAKDCAVNFEVDEAQEIELLQMSEQYKVPLWDEYYNFHMKKHKFYLEMENNGFAVDKARQEELDIKYTKMEQIAQERLVSLIGHEVNVKSPKQKISLFKELGLPVYAKAPTSEDSIVKMLGNHCKGKDGYKKKEILETILETTRIRDQKSRYITFTPDYDGRCKSSFNIISTETTRSSTSVLEKPVRPEKIGLAFHTISKHGRLAKDIRSMFVPDKGKIFLQADSSQAEARVVAVLSKDWNLLHAFDTIDIHRRTAALILGLTNELDLISDVIPSDAQIGKDSAERFCGKKTRHAGNYDMKKRRFMTEFNTDAQKFEINMSISEWKADNMLSSFHRASPNIKGVFHAEIKDAINSNRTIIDPFGGVRIFHGLLNESLYQEAYANIPQRTVSHLVQGAALNIHAELGDLVGHIRSHPINFISENHDSLLLQVPEKDADELAALVKKHMTAPIDFSLYCTLRRDYQLIIPCDIEVTDRTYGDLVKMSRYKEMKKMLGVSLEERMNKFRRVN